MPVKIREIGGVLAFFGIHSSKYLGHMHVSGAKSDRQKNGHISARFSSSRAETQY
jgi:hypothetical protein